MSAVAYVAQHISRERSVHRHIIERSTIDVGNPPSTASDNKWKEFQFNFHNFATLPSYYDYYIESPVFECNGNQWRLRVYPAGDTQTFVGDSLLVSLHPCPPGGSAQLTHESEISIPRTNGQKACLGRTRRAITRSDGIVYVAAILRSSIFDQSNHFLDDNGTFSVIISIKEDESKAQSTVFVPKNPIVTMIQDKFLDEETADVCFEVSSSDIEEDRARKRQRTFATFHAHSSILKLCAPMLASLFEDRLVKVAQIYDVCPHVFRHILYYVYGGSVPEEAMKTHAKDIIDAADRYSIVNLKLEAEAVYVKKSVITIDNAIDHLLYADAKNLALLKEAVIDFLTENSEEATEMISFTDDVPGHLMKDLLVAVSRKKRDGNRDDNNFNVMRVSELRKKLDEKELNVDGSPEVMIETLKRSASESEA
ncbi:hypothetical protein ACHAWT_007776 [Skeletonema menzelii]